MVHVTLDLAVMWGMYGVKPSSILEDLHVHMFDFKQQLTVMCTHIGLFYCTEACGDQRAFNDFS